MTAASSQAVANSMSRQIMPTKTKAGGVSARMGTSAASQTDRRAIVNASKPKAHPIGRRDQQEHAARPRRNRIDQRPQHGHRRRLPITERVLGNVLVNEFRIVGHDAG